MKKYLSGPIPGPTEYLQSNQPYKKQIRRSHPSLKPSHDTTFLCNAFVWFMALNALAIAPITVIFVTFGSIMTRLSNSDYHLDASDLAGAMAGVSVIRPNLLQLHKLFVWPRIRYRRTHISQIRFRQRRHLYEEPPMTIFIAGLGSKSIPLLVTISTRISDVVDALQHQNHLPIVRQKPAPFYLVGPDRLQAADIMMVEAPDLTMQELGVKSLSTLQLRVRLLGGMRAYENPRGWALDENKQLMDANKMGDWPYDPDDTVKAPNASGSGSSNTRQAEPRKSTRPRDTSKYEAYISAQRQDDDGNLVEDKPKKQRRSRKGKEKAVLQGDGGNCEGDDDGSDYTSGQESESEDEDCNAQVGNEELADSLPRKTIPANRDGKLPKRRPDKRKHTNAEHSVKAARSNDTKDVSQARSANKEELQPKGKKTNPIYLFYEEVSAPRSTNKDADSRDKYYKCYHGADRKIITLKHASRGNLTTLQNHVKMHFPLHFKLYELMRDRTTPPTPEEIQFANATKPFNGSLANDFIKTLQKSQRALDVFCQNGKQEPWDQQKFERLLINWIVACDQPFEEVERPEFRELMDYVHHTGTRLEIPSRHTVKRRIMSAGEKTEQGLRKMFTELDSKISLSLDNWTSPNGIAFMAIVAHYVTNDGKLEECLIDFRELHGEHSGVNMADAVWDTLQRYDIQHKILAVVMDNAYNNNTLLRSLETKLKANGVTDFSAKFSRIRCMPHTIHLAAIELLEAIGAITATESKRSEATRNYQESVLPPTENQVKNDDAALCEDLEDEDNSQDISMAIKKLRKIVLCVRSSPQRRKSWLQTAEDFLKKLRDAAAKTIPERALMLILDVRTRWSSTHQMLKRALDFSGAIDTFAAVTKDLRDYEMTEQDWDAIGKVCQWLKLFRDATSQMSSTKKPMLSRTHLIFRGLQDHLRKILRNLPDDIPPEIKDGLTESHKKLSDYYYKSDESPLYLWSALLDPRMSYNGLKKEFRDEADHLTFLEEMKRQLENYFVLNYFNSDNHEDASHPTSEPDSQSSITNFDHDETEYNFMACYETEDAVIEDELDQYFKLPQERMQNCDPVSWWYANKRKFPRLYRLARDIMTVPGSAVAVERVFSGGRDTISMRRANLNADTIRTLMIMKNRLRVMRDTPEDIFVVD